MVMAYHTPGRGRRSHKLVATRRLLDQVDGWMKPGTLTAFGAGKATMLNVLAQCISMGVVTGDVQVDGRALDDSFQRKTGYVEQQDLQLETSTVKEALESSALLRQPRSTKKADKLGDVNDIIDLLDKSEFADAVVGLPGQGLNVEQRKPLSIGVQLAPCDPDANPADWMLQVLNTQTHDWHQEWLDSLEFQSVQAELENLHAQQALDTPPPSSPRLASWPCHWFNRSAIPRCESFNSTGERPSTSGLNSG